MLLGEVKKPGTAAGAMMGLLFFARDAAHREHLKTDSYARHVALNEFYDAIVGLADKFAEAYQGEFGLIGEFDFLNRPVKDISEELGRHVKWIGANRTKVVPADDTSLQNIIDEIVGQYRATLYKLRFLR